MKSYADFSREELKNEREALLKSFSDFKALNLSLDMTRGKPSPKQLDISSGMFDELSKNTGFKAADGTDCRNYGVPAGLPEVRELFASILGTTADKVFLGNNSSLTLMYGSLMRAMVFGEHDSEKPWAQIEGKKWLCPAPGYDRHFRITETLGFELITVPMTDEGPDMSIVEELVAKDDKILGMWCVPVYSNPDGIVYSEETCRRIASMKTAAKDFRVYWDNAYVVHHLYDDNRGCVPDVLALSEECGNPSRFYEFASTSKITFAGAGVCCIAANKENYEHFKKYMAAEAICFDKVNQLAHAVYLKDMYGLEAVMKKHAELLRPKFEKALEVLESELEGTGAATWTKPRGGYFISVFSYPGTADKIVSMCAECGVKLTSAGATYPYGKDPNNSNIRLAPSFPSVDDIEKSTKILAVCIKLAAVEALLDA